RLLKSFAKLLDEIYGSGNCGHLSEDHFAVFTEKGKIEDSLERLFRESAELEGGNSLPVRVGVYVSRGEEVPVNVVCDRAKLACDSLGEIYESSFRYYEKKLSEDAIKRQYIVENIDKAIKERWIQVYYQPIVRAVNGRVSDEEALARWIDPANGFMSPADFIPYLEEAGLIYKLDLCVVDRVLEKIKDQIERGMTIVPHSINLSRSDFEMCDIVEEIRKRVDASGVGRDKIIVEITESMIGSDFEFMKDEIARFRDLGFSVWMDDFGSGYSSLDVLQSIRFNLLKFDMSFMQKLDEGDGGKIILTELMKMASSLGIDVACEGVETEAQVRFLREIGCSKLQGYYFGKPISYEALIELYASGKQVGYEDPEQTEYFEAIGRVNLYDLAVIANKEDETSFHNFFNTIPMSIVEITDGNIRFVRTNKSFRDFAKRFFDYDLSKETADEKTTPFGKDSSFVKLVDKCCDGNNRAFFDERLPDGSIAHCFARRVGANPKKSAFAAAVAVLSITAPGDGATYAEIARALAADYYNIYYIDLETDKFIEYSSPVGGEELALERHGEDFFESSKRDSYRIFEEDRETFYAAFSKENIIKELDEQGVFNATYRLVDTGVPMYVNMKVTRMSPEGKHIIMGISIIDAQKKHEEEDLKARQEATLFGRIAALSGNFIALYTIDPETGSYTQYSASSDYEKFAFAKDGDDFFAQGRQDGAKTVYPDDVSYFLENFTKENVLRDVEENKRFKLSYRLVMDGEPRMVSLRIGRVNESDGEKLIAGVRFSEHK
ncbi:MAG: EAL domain-containing protein, partial [Clostridia bacterium]|nr:EAL domain-containing protein [Clostridia bacterium]